MEFESKDAEMVLVKTSPEELKKLAAIIRAIHGWDYVMCEMDIDNALDLSERMEKAEGNSWIFHELEAFAIGSVLGTACHAITIEQVNHFSPIQLSETEIEKLMNDMDSIVEQSRAA